MRAKFESELMREDVVEYFLSKSKEEVREEYGEEVAQMVGYDQNNPHHCYTLWEHTIRAVGGIPREGLTDEQLLLLRIAAFFHDIGKPNVARLNEKNGSTMFIGHAARSVDVARPILAKMGYSEEEIEHICFFIKHHDDFMNYKTVLDPSMMNNKYFREINDETVAEVVAQNQYDFSKMGYNEEQIKYICYVLGHKGQQPSFKFKSGPIDMEEVKAKMKSGEYTPRYVPTERDYDMLLLLCQADAGAQSELAMRDGKKLGSRAEKVENMVSVAKSIHEAYKIINPSAITLADFSQGKNIDVR